ncbi:lipase family protein [Nocardioides sp.]|uniref:lipase family protein n=1 Tax=Nocardioides sp. TaxID=35761 RepID=UPI002CE6AB80|nr:lipase family protein [Nocardioides sp.]HSX65916.1 lipase family protein [Nocardioides sp.]
MPRWTAGVLGVLMIALGATLTLRPFSSLATLLLYVAAVMVATGVGDLVQSRNTHDRTERITGVAWVLAGAAVLVRPDLSLAALTMLVGIAMIVAGGLRVWAATRGRRTDTVTAVLGGAASAVFGVLALSWPDISILVIAVVFGARTVMHGFTLLANALRGAEQSRDEKRPDGRLVRIRRASGAALGLLVALSLTAVSVVLNQGSSGEVDDFYTAPADVPSEPGRLLRSEAFTRGIPSGARAWRILYTTTRDEGVPAVASGLVVVSATAPTGPRPVIAWAHGTTGFARPCAPSLMKDPFVAGAMPAVDQVLERGWAIVATDYIGLGTEGPHTYLVGQGEGRAVLDAVKAARQLTDVSLSDQTAVWGHSQGGGSALWAGQLAETYAPDVPLAGVVAMAPASDLTQFVGTLEHMPGGSVFEAFVISAYSAIYPDVKFDDYVRPGAITIERRAAERCLSDPGTLVSIATSLGLGNTVFSQPATEGPLGARLEENTPTGPIAAPLLIAQGTTDTIIEPSMQTAYVDRRCKAGQQVDYRTYAGRDHLGLVAQDSPLIGELMAWTTERFMGKAWRTPSCADGDR